MSDIPLNSLKRHPEFWFDDGSVVLVAQDTSFRVYRALLVAHSTVLADMFSSLNNEANSKLEGCPVAYLSDSPQDVGHFLRVLLPNAQPSLSSRKCDLSFPQLSAVIRLAHKYNAKAILEQALSVLEDLFPSDFDTWERGEFRKVELIHPVGVIGLAMLVNRPSLLPVAFYRCALLGADVIDGYTQENEKIEHLGHLDLKRCIQGRNQLASRAIDIISDIFSSHLLGCMCQKPRCHSSLQSVLHRALKDEQSRDPDVLQSWKSRIERWTANTGICQHCEKDLIDSDVRVRKQVWSSLPEIFGIEEDTTHPNLDDWFATP